MLKRQIIFFHLSHIIIDNWNALLRDKAIVCYNQQFIYTLDCLHIINLFDQVPESLFCHLLVFIRLMRKNNHSVILDGPGRLYNEYKLTPQLVVSGELHSLSILTWLRDLRGAPEYGQLVPQEFGSS